MRNKKNIKNSKSNIAKAFAAIEKSGSLPLFKLDNIDHATYDVSVYDVKVLLLANFIASMRNAYKGAKLADQQAGTILMDNPKLLREVRKNIDKARKHLEVVENITRSIIRKRAGRIMEKAGEKRKQTYIFENTDPKCAYRHGRVK